MADLAASLKEFGQAEPVVVRPLADPIGHYEILSGERRYVAAGVAGLAVLRCRVVTETTASGLVELAVANAAREDLDPIERAELLTRLISPVAEGGAGLDRAAAGRLFGLNSEGGVKNALRLLDLPEYFRRLVASGELAVRHARPLIALPDNVVEAFARWLKSEKQESRYLAHGGDDLASGLRHYLARYTRPLDREKFTIEWQQGPFPCLFKFDQLPPAEKAELDAAEIPGERKGTTRLVALNVEAWTRRQLPLVKAALAKRREGSATKKAAAAKANPAERRREADASLKNYTEDWVRDLLRPELSRRYRPELLLWLVGRVSETWPRVDIDELTEWAVAECGGRVGDVAKGPAGLAGAIAATFGTANKFWATVWRLALWPASAAEERHADLAPAGSIPERLPGIQYDELDDLARHLGATVAEAWAAAAATAGPERAMVERWLLRHNGEQIADLATELGHRTTETGRNAIAAELLERHAKRPLRMPKLIAAVAKGAKL